MVVENTPHIWEPCGLVLEVVQCTSYGQRMGGNREKYWKRYKCTSYGQCMGGNREKKAKHLMV